MSTNVQTYHMSQLIRKFRVTEQQNTRPIWCDRLGKVGKYPSISDNILFKASLQNKDNWSYSE